MNRKKVITKMMEMGFHASNKGFHYIIRILEEIEKDGMDLKISVLYQIMGKEFNSCASAVERCVRHEIELYYFNTVPHPLLENRFLPSGRFSNHEFLCRLYMIIFELEAEQ